MNIEKKDLILGGLALSCLAVVSYAGVVTNKLRQVERKLNRTLDEIVDKDIDISKDLIDKAVERAARDAAELEVTHAMKDAADDIVKGFESAIKTAVEDEFKNQKADVAKTMKHKIEDIDIREIKREVVREAKEECAKKLKKDLDEISDKYTEQIESMSSIYSTIATKLESIGD